VYGGQGILAHFRSHRHDGEPALPAARSAGRSGCAAAPVTAAVWGPLAERLPADPL